MVPGQEKSFGGLRFVPALFRFSWLAEPGHLDSSLSRSTVNAPPCHRPLDRRCPQRPAELTCRTTQWGARRLAYRSPVSWKWDFARALHPHVDMEMGSVNALALAEPGTITQHGFLQRKWHTSPSPDYHRLEDEKLKSLQKVTTI